MKVEIRSPKTTDEWQEYYDLRYRVLRQPWNQPRGSERNEGDKKGNVEKWLLEIELIMRETLK